MRLNIFAWIVGVWVCFVVADEADPIVCLERGCVRGKSFKGNLKEFEGFLGIPYAQPPVDELRLKVSGLVKISRRRLKNASRVKLTKVFVASFLFT
jgi:Carboxylesterase family